MPWDGSGNFNRNDGTVSGATVWVQNRDTGTKILATRHDNHDEDLATGLENCITKDGQNTATANLPMGGFGHTNVAASSSRTMYARTSQVQDGAFNFNSTGGSSNAYTLSVTPAITAYTGGQVFYFKANHTNTTSCTLAVSGLSAIPLRMGDGTVELPSGSIKQNYTYGVVYDSAGRFIVVAGLATGMTSLVWNNSASTIFPDTSDGSDNKSIQIGHADNTRGAYILLAGNEHVSIPGQVVIRAGNNAGASAVDIGTSGAHALYLSTNNTNRFQLDGSSGHLYPVISSTYDLGTSSLQVRNLNYSGDLARGSNGTWSASVSGTGISSVVVTEASYCRIGQFIEFQVYVSFNSAGTGSNFTISAPFSGVAHPATSAHYAYGLNGGTTDEHLLWRYTGSNFLIYKFGGGSLSSGTYSVCFQGKYRAV